MTSTAGYGRLSPSVPPGGRSRSHVEYQGNVVAIKKKKKQKQPQRSEAEEQGQGPPSRKAGRSTDMPSPAPPQVTGVHSGGANVEETRQDGGNSPFAVDNEEEFRNVWDGGDDGERSGGVP